MEFIQGEKFIELADNKYVFYRHTHEVDNFFKNEVPSTPFILISHNSDGSVEEIKKRDDCATFSLAPKNLIKWFGQNIKVRNSKIQSIPIGLENSQWFSEVEKIKKIKQIVNTPKKIENFIYLNLNIETNVSERKNIYDIANNLEYITKENGKNVNYMFNNYLNKIYNHKFIISAAGNGEDCHRTWESLYVGSIPILKRTINSLYYDDLPICFVNDWEQLKDKKYLNEELNRLETTNFNLKKLYFEYWKNLIEKEKNNLIANK